jgi:hypothetical protein
MKIEAAYFCKMLVAIRNTVQWHSPEDDNLFVSAVLHMHSVGVCGSTPDSVLMLLPKAGIKNW